MRIETSRFGAVEVDENRFIRFEHGILGFPNDKEFALIQTAEGSGFYWLQAVTRADLAFVVCDPRIFVSDYQVPVKVDDLESIGLSEQKDAQIFIIVNKVDDLLTGNLQGPLVINHHSRAAKQLVLSDKRYSTRHPLMRLQRRETSASRIA